MADEKAYTSEALTSSLGLYKHTFPDAAAAGVADDLLTIMQQVRVCSSLRKPLVLQVRHWTDMVQQMPTCMQQHAHLLRPLIERYSGSFF